MAAVAPRRRWQDTFEERRFLAPLLIAPAVTFIVTGAEKGFVLLLRDNKKNRWDTHFKGTSFEKANGEKVSSETVAKLLLLHGDGTVTKQSLAAEVAAGHVVVRVRDNGRGMPGAGAPEQSADWTCAR